MVHISVIIAHILQITIFHDKYHVDDSIIGGMIVSIGDKYVDMSMSAKLNKYTEIIKSAA